MIYDAVVIGAGLSGFIAALKLSSEGKKVIILSRGLGNLYSSSGYIDLLGYYPTDEKKPLLNPLRGLEKLISEKPQHPYSLTGPDIIKESVEFFLKITEKAGVPYLGTINKNTFMPTAAGTLVPVTFYPETSKVSLSEAGNIVVVGIKELMDFFPAYVAGNLTENLNKKVEFLWVNLGLSINREVNSYDIALSLEKENIRGKLIEELKKNIEKGSLILIPAVLGAKSFRKVISHIEEETGCKMLEIPTLPPSLMGYRLAENTGNYLKKNGVEMITGYPVDYVKTGNGICEEAGLTIAGGRIKKIRSRAFILATGGILGEGLQVYPYEIREKVFDLPVSMPGTTHYKDFFALKENPLSCAGVSVNQDLNPVNDKKEVLFKNVFVTGATLGGYDPFLEKSGNGVAISTGYKAALMVMKAGGKNE